MYCESIFMKCLMELKLWKFSESESLVKANRESKTFHIYSAI